MNQAISHRDDLLLEVVRSAEETALQLRHYAAAVISPPREVPDCSERPLLPVRVEVTPEGWVLAALPVILPRRTDEDRSRFLASSLWNAIRAQFRDKPLPKFHTCVLIYEHVYTFGCKRRFIEHDNMELKHCQDVLEAAFLTNDSAALCFAFQCSHFGEAEGTRIWIVPAGQFPAWLETHKIYWADTPKT